MRNTITFFLQNGDNFVRYSVFKPYVMIKAEIPGMYGEKIRVSVEKGRGVSKVGDDSRFDHVDLESTKHISALLEQQTLSLIFLERLSELTQMVQISGGYGVKKIEVLSCDHHSQIN